MIIDNNSGSYVKFRILGSRMFYARVSEVFLNKRGSVTMTIHDDLNGSLFRIIIDPEYMTFCEMSNQKSALRFAKNHPKAFTKKSLRKLGTIVS